MSNNKIDDMSDIEAKSLLNDIANTLGVGGKARTSGVILANIENAFRRSSCLSRIERHHVVSVEDEDGEECSEQLLNWGESPDKYIETYLDVMKITDKHNRNAVLDEAIEAIKTVRVNKIDRNRISIEEKLNKAIKAIEAKKVKE